MHLGHIDKAFISPTHFRTGGKFSSKSEERRFFKEFDPIIKLKHILLSDADTGRTYTMQVLAQFFSENEIATFSELGISNFLYVLRHLQLDSLRVSPRDFILSLIRQHVADRTAADDALGRTTG